MDCNFRYFCENIVILDVNELTLREIEVIPCENCHRFLA
jgi:hypothetical protein